MKAGDWMAASLAVLVVGAVMIGLFWVTGAKKAPASTPIASAFDASEAAYIHETGEGAIEGRVFVRLWSGEEVPCTDKRVLLVPQTALSRERMAHLYGTAQAAGLRRHVRNPVQLEMPDPKYWDYMRQATCEETGSFRFAGVADGDYFVVGSVSWKETNGWVALTLMQPVQVQGGQPAHVILTPRRQT